MGVAPRAVALRLPVTIRRHTSGFRVRCNGGSVYLASAVVEEYLDMGLLITALTTSARS